MACMSSPDFAIITLWSSGLGGQPPGMLVRQRQLKDLRVLPQVCQLQSPKFDDSVLRPDCLFAPDLLKKMLEIVQKIVKDSGNKRK